ncbi:YopX family protein [Exiguobacterium sp. BMC-KP]|uniref:YopX family protein n=1 Tax=Exiguobacterium sp. BMC-KP TaxID=1684312 RepID=UPI0006AA45C0|nr:YopX family protein [Exiguobacterium sp. BMC-KP]
MREIKFRAWDNVKDRMYFIGEEEDVQFELCSGGSFVGYDLGEDWFPKLEHLQYMQYTGQKDKNGVEIYEGDILEFADKNFLVIWDDYRFNLKDFYEFYLDYPTEAFSESLQFKIVGNVYEHPHLLEEERT